MTTIQQDQWAQWLLQQRHGGDPEALKAILQPLFQVRDAVLQHATVAEGNTLLDIGSGDGLIAFGALPLVGSTGKVIFSDISQPLLQHCQALAQQMGVIGQCQFVHNPAHNLESIPANSVDVVTVRSVLVYVQDKLRALREFYRVLKPRGRLSLFEPIPALMYPEPAHLFYGYDAAPIQQITQKLMKAYQSTFSHLMNFTERDLFEKAEQAGFSELYMELQMAVIPDVGRRFPNQQLKWEAFLQSALNPLAPTIGDAMRAVLTPEEAQQFTAHMRPLVEKNLRTERSVVAYLWAMKY